MSGIVEANFSKDSGIVSRPPGAAKAWVNFHHATTINASYNITSITDDAQTGDYTITIATDFSSAAYARVFGGSTYRIFSADSDATPTAGALPVELRAEDGGGGTHTLVDAETDAAMGLSVAMFGDQA